MFRLTNLPYAFTELGVAMLIDQLRHDFEELKMDIQDILADQNEINEDTRLQLELINQSLAELQAKGNSAQPQTKPQRKIGFVRYEEAKEEDKK